MDTLMDTRECRLGPTTAIKALAGPATPSPTSRPPRHHDEASHRYYCCLRRVCAIDRRNRSMKSMVTISHAISIIFFLLSPSLFSCLVEGEYCHSVLLFLSRSRSDQLCASTFAGRRKMRAEKRRVPLSAFSLSVVYTVDKDTCIIIVVPVRSLILRLTSPLLRVCP